jgi:immunoglobulin heavy chain|uniref:Ig-like domain-containing protein n=1 Tax=Castor canadensis TaxID=51338 RepID=A0A8C0W8P0_CASCN
MGSLVCLTEGVCCSLFPGVLSQGQLQESGRGLAKPSETLTLTCTITGVSLPSCHMHWMRQPPQKGLEWVGVLWSNGNTGYNSALKFLLSITRDTSKNQVTLALSSLIAEDTAMYYCARDTVRRLQSEPRHKLPCRVLVTSRGCLAHTEHRATPGAGAVRCMNFHFCHCGFSPSHFPQHHNAQ